MPELCPQCKQETLYHNEGISKKNNKPYANNKCKCGYLEWLEVPAGQPAGQPTSQAGGNEEVLSALRQNQLMACTSYPR